MIKTQPDTPSDTDSIDVQKSMPPVCLKKCDTSACNFQLDDPFVSGPDTLQCAKKRCPKKCKDKMCRPVVLPIWCCDESEEGNKSCRNSCRKFLHCLRDYLWCEYGLVWCPEYDRVFSFMFWAFEGRYDELIMCLSYMVYGTSGFTQLVGGHGCANPCDSEFGNDYRSRGFLQVTTLKNYRIASNAHHNYVKCPWKLASFTVESMKAALKVYHFYVYRCHKYDHDCKDKREHGCRTKHECDRHNYGCDKYDYDSDNHGCDRYKCGNNYRRRLTFTDIVYALRPCDSEGWAEDDEWFDKIYCARLAVYKDLCRRFCARFLPGKRRFHD